MYCNTFKLFYVLGLSLLLQLTNVQELAAQSNSDLVEHLLLSWRSPDRHIPGNILQREAEIYFSPELKRELRDLSLDQLLAQLKIRQREPWHISKADVENLLKIRQLLCHAQDCTDPYVAVGEATSFHRDEVLGAESSALEALSSEFATNTFEPANLKSEFMPRQIFDLRAHKLTELSLKSMIDNDAYAFTVAAIMFDLGLHKKTAVFENVTRGADAYPYMVAAGQDEAIDILQHARFTKYDVEVIRKYVSARVKVSDEFYDWLLNWRFRGTLRTLPVGTIVFPGTPINQVVADPASAILVESLINPWMSSKTNLLTTAVRNMVAAGSIAKVAEGGTRRLVTGSISAQTALLAGASSTSNLMIADLLGGEPYGTVNHALMSAFPDNFAAMEAVLGRFKGPGLVLPDTAEILGGQRDAVLAGGDLASTFRLDSAVMQGDRQLSTTESINALRTYWRQLGRGEWNGVVTNDLSEQTLFDLANSGVPVEVVSMGGAFATSSKGVAHGNFVYKLVQLGEGDDLFFPIKVANKSKSTEPGAKDLYRISHLKNGIYLRDLKTRVSENPSAFLAKDEHAEMLIVNGFVGTKRTMNRATPGQTIPYIQRQLHRLNPMILHPNATRKDLGLMNYQVKSSPELERIRDEAIARVSAKKDNARLVVLMQADLEAAAYAWLPTLFAAKTDTANPYGPTVLSIVKSGGVNPQGIKVLVDWLKQHLQHSEVEIDATSSHWIDRLCQYLDKYGPSEVPLDIALLRQDFDVLLRKSLTDPKVYKLLHSANFYVMGQSNLYHDRGLQNWHKYSFEARPNGLVSLVNKDVRVIYMNPKELANFYAKEQNVRPYRALMHITDPQETFRYIADGDPNNGTMGTRGTLDSVPNIERAISAAARSNLFKISFSGDAHFDLEVDDANINNEFHAPYNFPRHGMKNESGPEGEKFIPEIAAALNSAGHAADMIRIPAHKVSANGKELELEPFELAKLGEAIFDPETFLHFEKNGQGSYSVTVNPRYFEYLHKVDPLRTIPHFHLGWCTDFCNYFPMRDELLAGFQVIFIYDAAAGVGRKTTGKTMRELLDLGLVLMTSEQFAILTESWQKRLASYTEVSQDIYRFTATQGQQNKAAVMQILNQPDFADPQAPGELGETCALLWKN